ncbi:MULTISPECIES: glycerol-3-phosphate 1-O-acyltransferase [Gordonia]|uniref:Glycerol-3-phosphate 1-O-acyltransferase n=1 Tax=Gordonia aquimaris TaxID=2984863 RepID=A0A9X3D8F7_9ACTN|nr:MULTISPECIES: glycerol-3-phosphate 1-O-acyltransferase [Gordonia]MAU80534.1 glycerol-3-phosphate acyltransferase [Gordonia sp. (in: high G+C Gram-positive bacteria)]MCX2966833.1 glycerol-3-phosphate 1-O-acyltransferase [Gordonia aquimaris]
MHMADEVVVLAETRTSVELRAVTDWASTAHPDAPVRRPDDVDFDALPPSTTLVPVRPVWLPAVRQGERRVTLGDVLVLSNPRRPVGLVQPLIRGRRPDSLRVVEGAPATIAELRERYARDLAEGAPFGKYVAVQASLSAERAERQIIGDRYKVPQLVAEQVSSSARFQAGAAKLAAELGRPTETVVAEAVDKLSGFVATQSRLMDDVFSATFDRLHERAWHVTVDLDTLNTLRTLNKSTGLVFLPSHRSYVDPLVLAKVLRSNDFPPTLVLGGNNLSFWPVGPVARRAGMIFIRRKFGSDPVYKFAMRSYLSYIVEKRFNLEWYIEGGRSRTGKLRKPMMGLLNYVVDAVTQLDSGDVTIVPTSIVYDQLQEIGAMAAEDAGGAKKPEGIGWLLRYAKAQRSYLGEARVRFGTPFSLRSALDDAGEGRARLEKVAFRVMDEINSATPISATSLAGFALLGAPDRAYTLAEIEAILVPLLDYIARRGLPGPDPARCRGVGLTQTLRVLAGNGVVSCFDGGSEPVWSIVPDNRAVAAYYRNGALHHFVNRAIVEVNMLAVAEGEVRATGDYATDEGLLAVAQREALRIRDLLKFEFFFPVKDEYFHRLAAELDLIAPQWRERIPTQEWTYEVLHGHTGALLARRTLQPFFDAQLVAATRLVQLGTAACDKADLIADCLGLGRQLSLQGVVRSKDSVSKDLYDGAYRLADNRDLIHGDGVTDLLAARQEWLDEVNLMRDRLARIAEIEDIQPALGQKDAR